MKKIFLLLLISLFTLPVNAVCSITGEACAAPQNFEANSLIDRHIPNNLQNIQRTDAFQPQTVTPMGTNVRTSPSPVTKSPEAGDYDADCQFGTCLPGAQNNEIIR